MSEETEKLLYILADYSARIGNLRVAATKKSKLHGLPTKEVNYHKGCIDVYTGVLQDINHIMEKLQEEDSEEDTE